MKHPRLSLLTFYMASIVSCATAEEYNVPLDTRSNIVGEIRTVAASDEDTLIDVARRFDTGYDSIVKSNSGLNVWIPGAGAEVTIPSMFTLPDAPRNGIVLNIAELRLYFFPPSHGKAPKSVLVFPVSIGRMDWKTPLGKSTVVRKQENPTWSPPKTIRDEHALEGDPLPEVIAGGQDDNPLGHYALYLGIPGYLIHGTDEGKSFGIGMRVTHGCVRMYPEDIRSLYPLVNIGTPVYLINQPVKMGWKEGKAYLEVHQPLDDEEREEAISPDEVITKLIQFVGERGTIDADLVRTVTERGDGIPTPVGEMLEPPPPAKR